jgi:hypothetical protein
MKIPPHVLTTCMLLVLIVATLFLSALTWSCAELAITLREIRPKVLVTIESVDRATIAAGAAAANLGKASRALQLPRRKVPASSSTWFRRSASYRARVG